MGKLYLFLILVFFLFATSCIKTKKQTYFQGDITTSSTDSFSNPIKYYQLRPGDILYIKIISIDPRLSAFFNTDMGAAGAGLQVSPGNMYIQGYLVNDSGYVELPILGNLAAKGKTLNQFRAELSVKINEMVSTSTVIVKFASFKISVLGEVNNPGETYFTNERVSILEVLGSAGDLTVTGKRTNIAVIRQHLDGSFEKGELNLNDINVVHSPYYFLQPNDIVYVPPTATLAAKFNVQNMFLALSTITTIVLILNVIKL